MIMSTTTITMSAPTNAAARLFGGVAAACIAGFAAFLTWRQQRQDIARLRSMSDFELKDIGIDRASIGPAVRSGRNGELPARVDIL
jgi:uncharacterized protein YjiS (DUF1127 family)